jgi:hypothetical protein
MATLQIWEQSDAYSFGNPTVHLQRRHCAHNRECGTLSLPGSRSAPFNYGGAFRDSFRRLRHPPVLGDLPVLHHAFVSELQVSQLEALLIFERQNRSGI